jgi:hypothetical protein
MNERQPGFIDSFTLKMIAIITMVIDHVGYIFFPEVSAFRIIGRIAFPIFCFLIVEGFQHTRNHLNYLIRLCIFALLSEIPFDLAIQGTIISWQQQNVFFTLALGLASLFCLEEMNTHRRYMILLIFVWVAAFFLHCDYGLGGVLLIDIFYKTKKSPWVRLILVTLVMYLFYGTFELYGLIALPLIMLYNGKRGGSAKMLFYWFYPVHLLVLYLVSVYL